jgi:two-component system LytT family response regulator
MVARSLNYMETRLDPAIFFRANREAIINLLDVECIEPCGNDGFLSRLQSGPGIVVFAPTKSLAQSEDDL